MYKCDPKVRPPQLNASTIGTRLIFGTKDLIEEAPISPLLNVQISVSATNHNLTRE